MLWLAPSVLLHKNPFGLELTHEQACFGGMLFGMDSGIIGGVLTMPPFMA
jgi:hypothetical protein